MKQQSIFYGAIWLTAANLLIRTVSMAFQVYISKLLGAAGVGLLQLILTVGVLAMTIGTSGARVAATCLVAEEYGKGNPAGIRRAVALCLRYGAVVSTLAAAALFVLADFLATRWIGDIRAASSIRLFALALPLNCLWSVLAGYFTASNQIKKLVFTQFFDRLLSIALTVPLLFYWAGADTERSCCAIVGGSGAATVLSFIFLMKLYRKTRPDVPESEESMGKRLFGLCVPLAFNEYVRSGLNTLENLLIPKGLKRYGKSYEASIAAYGTIEGMTFPVIMFPATVLSSLSDLMIPELAKCRAGGNRERIAALVQRCLRMSLLYAVAVGGFMYCLGPELGELLYDSAEAGMYIRLFAPVLLMLYMDAIVDGMLKGLIEQVACMRYNTVTSILDVALIWFLLPRYGIGGFFFSFVASHALNFFLSLGRLMKITDYRPSLPFLIKTAAAAALALVLTAPLASTWQSLPVLVGVILRGAVFFAVLAVCFLVTTALSREDLRWLRRVIRPGRAAGEGQVECLCRNARAGR